MIAAAARNQRPVAILGARRRAWRVEQGHKRARAAAMAAGVGRGTAVRERVHERHLGAVLAARLAQHRHHAAHGAARHAEHQKMGVRDAVGAGRRRHAVHAGARGRPRPAGRRDGCGLPERRPRAPGSAARARRRRCWRPRPRPTSATLPRRVLGQSSPNLDTAPSSAGPVLAACACAYNKSTTTRGRELVPNTAPTVMVMAQQIDEKIDHDVFDGQPRARGPGTHGWATSCRVCAAGDANCGRGAARSGGLRRPAARLRQHHF